MPADVPGLYVVGILLDPAKQRVVLIKKNKPERQRGKWNGPGGHVQVGESSLAAVIREFEEETGALVEDWKLMATLIGSHVERKEPFTCAMYVACSPAFHDVTSATAEHVEKFRIDDLPRSLMPNLNWLIPMAALDNDLVWPYEIQES